MKKTLAFVLMLAAVLMCSVAFAGTLDPTVVDGDIDALAPTVATDMTSGTLVNVFGDGNDVALFEITHNGADYDYQMYTEEYGTKHVWTKGAVGTGMTANTTLQSPDKDLAAVGGTWRDEFDNSYLNGETTCWLEISYTNQNGDPVTLKYQFYADWTNYLHGWFGYSVKSFTSFTLPCWYPNNTANSFGPKVNGNWQTYSVVDLTVQGAQEFDLIGAGAWKLGTVTVTVDGDNVTVDYLMSEDINTRDTWDDITVDSEYLNFFADANTIDLSAESAFAFGQTYSIADDLGGDTTVCIVVSNKVDYPSHSPYVVRFWPNMPENKAIVEAMNALLAQ